MKSRTSRAEALKDGDLIESSVVSEWKAETASALLISVLETKYGTTPPEVEAAIRGTTDLHKLTAWVPQAVATTTLDEFRAAVGI